MYFPEAVVRPRFYLPSPPPFSLSRRFLFNLVYWWIQVWFSPVTFLVKLLYAKLAPYALPPVEFLWRNKFNFLKAGILSVFYIITTLFIAMISYYLLRSFFIVKEHSYDSLYFDFNAPLPTAAVKFNSDSLVQGQPYNAVVELELPESPPNVDIGMFMITLKIFSDAENASSSLILESSRPCMLRYKTGLLRTVHALSFSLPSLVGLYEEKQNLDVSLAENFMPSQTYDAVHAVVVLSKPGIQLYSSILHIRASLSWLSYFVLRWPITSFFVGTTLFSALHAPWLGILYLLFYLRIATPAEPMRPARPPSPPAFVREVNAAQRERMERELTLRARMERETHLRTHMTHETIRMEPAVPRTSPRVRADLWGILDEVEQEEGEQERLEMEEELKRRLAERRREREREEVRRGERMEASGEQSKKEGDEGDSKKSGGSEGSVSSGEWIEVSKDQPAIDEQDEGAVRGDEEEDEEGAESSSGLRRRRRDDL